MTEDTDPLTEFLLARLEDDRHLAEYGCAGQGEYSLCGDLSERLEADWKAKRRIVERASRLVCRRTFDPTTPMPSPELTFSGGRVYADPHLQVDVTETYKQEVAANSEPSDPATLRDLASVYSDHPDFREEWKP